MTEPYDSGTVEALAGAEDRSAGPGAHFFFKRYVSDLQVLAKNDALSCDMELPGAEDYCKWAAGKNLPLFYRGGGDYTIARSFRDLHHHILQRKARGWK